MHAVGESWLPTWFRCEALLSLTWVVGIWLGRSRCINFLSCCESNPTHFQSLSFFLFIFFVCCFPLRIYDWMNTVLVIIIALQCSVASFEVCECEICSGLDGVPKEGGGRERWKTRFLTLSFLTHCISSGVALTYFSHIGPIWICRLIQVDGRQLLDPSVSFTLF